MSVDHENMPGMNHPPKPPVQGEKAGKPQTPGKAGKAGEAVQPGKAGKQPTPGKS